MISQHSVERVVDQVRRINATCAAPADRVIRTEVTATLTDVARVKAWLTAAEADLVRRLDGPGTFPEADIADATRCSLSDASKQRERSQTLDAADRVAASRGNGDITAGTLVALAALVTRVYQPLTGLTNARVDLMTSMVSFERVFEVLDAEPDIVDAVDARSMPTAEGEVAFDHVDFSYTPDKQILFDNTFHVPAGQTVGLVGPTGAGKSTIINLLTRFYDIDDGTITIDGVDIADIRLDDLRHRCGVVLQVPLLFSETVMYNLQ